MASISNLAIIVTTLIPPSCPRMSSWFTLKSSIGHTTLTWLTRKSALIARFGSSLLGKLKVRSTDASYGEIEFSIS